MEDFRQRWEEWNEDPGKYWARMARRLRWDKPWDKLVDMSDPRTIKWFVGGELSLCYNCLDKHVDDGFGDHVAIIQESLYTKETRKISFNQVLDQVSRLAGVLHDCGVKVGDHVFIYMPIIPEAMIAMLAVCRIGGVFTSTMPGEAEALVKQRIGETQPKVIVTTNAAFDENGEVPMKNTLDSILKAMEYSPSKRIVFQRSCAKPAKLNAEQDLCWEEALQTATPHPCIPVEATQPLFIIYTSGSTGKPKGIMHSVGGFAVSMFKDDLKSFNCMGGHVFWGMTQFMWIGGTISMCFGPLLGKTATVIYEGRLVDPDVGDICRVLATHDITSIFIITDTLRQLRKKDPTGEIVAKYKSKFSLKHFRTGGSAIDIGTIEYCRKAFGVPLALLYGQTEVTAISTFDLSDGLTIGDIPVLSTGKPSPGWQVKILRDDGTEADAGEVGHILIKLPVPPGVMLGIFKNENMFLESYLSKWPGYYETKDQGKIDSNGNFFVTNRTDSVFRVLIARYSCDGVEQVIYTHTSVAECCVALKHELDEETQEINHIPFGFYTSRKDLKDTAQNSKVVKQLVINQFGEGFQCLHVFWVKHIPMTVNGKPSRSVIQAIINNNYDNKGKPLSATDGITDIYEAIKGLGQ